jgi:transcriptional regulator with XRE-family HTH domain
MNYSRSHIAQVEAGHKMATPAFVAAAASALAVDPAELFGQPYRGETARDDRVHAMIPHIRHALETIDIPADLEAPPRSLDELKREVAALRRLYMAASYVRLGARLPALLTELSVHVNESPSPRAWELLNASQALAAGLARRLGYNDLAAIGIRGAAEAAEHGDDPNLPRLAGLSRALLLMTMGAWGQGLRLVQHAGTGMDLSSPASRAVYGALQLRAAVLSARAGEESAAWAHFGLAEEVVRRYPERGRDFYALQFNAANVALHGVAVAVELRDFDEAVRRDRAPDFRTTGLPPERRAHHEVDMARALLELGHDRSALGRLLSAEKAAPQMVRYHPAARAVVTHLVDRKRELPEPLRGIQSRMHL